MSAAFDTVDHQILIGRLRLRLGLAGTVLKWFSSYLQERKLSVTVKGCRSSQVALHYGVPQGSVLGPILFTVYTLPLGDVMRKSEVPFQFYADDNQLLNFMRCGNAVESREAVSQTETCTSDVKAWLVDNKLALNAPKTDMINIVSSRRTGSVQGITVDGVWVPKSSCVKDLGVWFDEGMNMQTHIKNVCKAANSTLYKIGRIRKYLDQPCTERLVHALVTSKLDYNNALLFGLPKKTILPLQRIQNRAARLVSKTRKSII